MVRHHHAVAAVALALALTANLAPSASADPPPLARAEAAIAAAQSRANQASTPAPCGDVCSSHGYPFVSAQPASVLVTSGGGFNWGDAGIGAASCFVLLGIALAGTHTLTKDRKRHLAEQRTIATS
jgi:hypothetical protein